MAREDIFELQTRRLRLRPLRLEDWPAVQRIGGHPLVALMLASTCTPWPKAAVQAWITARRYRGRPGFCAAIVRPGLVQTRRAPRAIVPISLIRGIGAWAMRLRQWEHS